MAVDVGNRPLIWVLKGLRAGDNAQAMELALRLGGRVESKQLVFNGLHRIPNWLGGASLRHVTAASASQLRPPWPDLVVATGRRTAAVSLWIKQQSDGRTKSVQIGRPRMDLRCFDLVVTTPQYGLPALDNVAVVSLPFAAPKAVADTELRHFEALWQTLPRPWILGVVGGAKFPLRLNDDDLRGFGRALERAAADAGGSVILLDSPRSPTAALDKIATELRAPHWIYRRGQSDNPYQAALKLCDHLMVTSDSVSMVGEMLQMEKPVWVYDLPTSSLVPRWSTASGVGAWLATRGILHPPRRVDDFIRMLKDNGLIGDAQTGQAPTLSYNDEREHSEVVKRIKLLLSASRG